MTWSFLILCMAASALIAFSTSALLGLSVALFRQRLDGLTAAAQARVLFGVALLPALACAAVMLAALAPSFGWIVDHCSPGFDAHDHPHICTEHAAGAWPGWTLIGLGLLLGLRVLLAVGRLLYGASKARGARRALARISHFDHGLRVLPFAEPQAFVVGALRPEVFVTRGLLSKKHADHLDPVLAHERAHLGRRDPLRRLLASVALAFHLPGIAALIERRLVRAHEMAADAEAAIAMNSPERVARALVRLARAQRHSLEGLGALAFAGSDIEARVAALLDRTPKHDHPRQAVLLATVALLCAIVAARASAVHHAVETVLGVFGA